MKKENEKMKKIEIDYLKTQLLYNHELYKTSLLQCGADSCTTRKYATRENLLIDICEHFNIEYSDIYDKVN